MLDDTPQVDSLETFMRAMFTSLLVGLSRSLKDQQLSVTELAALHLIDRHGQLRVGELAKLLDVTLPTASRAVAVLVDQGLILRTEDPADRRSRTLTLSDAGGDLIEATSAERVDMAIATAAELPGPVMERIAAVLAALHSETGKVGGEQNLEGRDLRPDVDDGGVLHPPDQRVPVPVDGSLGGR